MARNRNADATADAAPAPEAPPAPDLAAAYDALLAQHNGALTRIAELEAALAQKATPAAPPAPAANPYQFHPQARTFVFCKGPYSAAGDIRRIKALNQSQAEAQLRAEVADASGFAFRGCLG